MRLARGQLGCHRAAERTAIEDDVVGSNVLLGYQPVIRRIGGRVATGFGRPARAAAEAGVIEDEHGDSEALLKARDVRAAKAQVARVAVTIEKGATAWLPAFRWTPPGVNRHAVVEDELDVLCVNLRGRR